MKSIKKFLPIPFQSFFLKTFSKSDDGSLLDEFDALDELNNAKQVYAIDVSSTRDETEVSSLNWEDSDESRKESSRTLAEAEKYTNYLDSESLTEPIPLIPFHSIHLHDRNDLQSSIASSTQTADEKDEERLLAQHIKDYEIWWGAGEATDTFYGQQDSPSAGISSATNVSSQGSSTHATRNSSQHDKSTEYSDKSALHRAPALPKAIEFNSDQQTAAINRDKWLFDPVESLVFWKASLDSPDDAHWEDCSRLHELLTSHINMIQDDTDNVANICALVDQHPHIAQVRYYVPLVLKEERNDEPFLSLPCYPLSILCATGHLEGIRACYEAFPESIGYVDKWIGTALHYACVNVEVEAVIFLLDRFPEAARITNSQYQSPLHLACSVRCSPLERKGSSQLRIVELLLDIFPTAARLVDENGYTPMHTACEVGAPVEVLAALIQSSSGVLQMTTRNLEKALHVAAFHSESTEIVRFLLNKDPSQAAAIDEKMQTPLHKACMADPVSIDIVKLLFNAYPNALTLRDDNIETPGDIAVRLGRTSAELLRILEHQQ